MKVYDPHTRRASKIFNVAMAHVTEKQRNYAKLEADTESYTVSQQMAEHMAGYKQRALQEGNRQ